MKLNGMNLNRCDAQQLLPLLTAFINGRAVQVQGLDGKWYDEKTLNLDPTTRRDWRIKRDPGEEIGFDEVSGYLKERGDYAVQIAERGLWLFITKDHNPIYSDRKYRLAPKPTLRPWKPEEVPVGAQLRERAKSSLFGGGPTLGMLILGTSREKIQHGPVHQWTFQDVLETGEWKWPQETEWKRCGVEE
jgi:hypothetical protein